jgi:transposase
LTETMTSAGLDVHARSIDAAAVCVATGELTRRRFGGEPGPVIGWLRGLPGPVHACYEAGPTGFGLQRAASAAGDPDGGGGAVEDAARGWRSGQD